MNIRQAAGILLLLSPAVFAAEDTYYISNSIGQDVERISEVDLYDPATASGYILKHSAADEQKSIRTLSRNREPLWEEVRTDRGVHTHILRTDPEGNILQESHYTNGLITSEHISTGGVTIETDYQYTPRSRLSSTLQHSGEGSARTRYFIGDSGGLSGLMIERTDGQQELLEQIVLFDRSAGTAAIGTSDAYRMTITREDELLMYEYRQGDLIYQEIRAEGDDGFQRIDSYDHLLDRSRRQLIDTDSGLIVQETIGSKDAPDVRLMTYDYDPQGRLMTKMVLQDEKRTVHEYEYVDEETVETIGIDGIVNKIITYERTGERNEQLYLDGVFYATVHYGEDNTILKVTYADE